MPIIVGNNKSKKIGENIDKYFNEDIISLMERVGLRTARPLCSGDCDKDGIVTRLLSQMIFNPIGDRRVKPILGRSERKSKALVSLKVPRVRGEFYLWPEARRTRTTWLSREATYYLNEVQELQILSLGIKQRIHPFSGDIAIYDIDEGKATFSLCHTTQSARQAPNMIRCWSKRRVTNLDSLDLSIKLLQASVTRESRHSVMEGSSSSQVYALVTARKRKECSFKAQGEFVDFC
ncbi:hypothetical protein JB92DRAFT_2837931 [Gautieria morchelliformis]|nr:hypothetical protein JB92DRAFT_2837931 [Gautieria morchelliformis]